MITTKIAYLGQPLKNANRSPPPAFLKGANAAVQRKYDYPNNGPENKGETPLFSNYSTHPLDSFFRPIGTTYRDFSCIARQDMRND